MAKTLFRFIPLTYIIFCSCNTWSPARLFSKKTPHETYLQSLIDSKLENTAMGSAWITLSREAFKKAVKISIPFKETGYFAAERVGVSSYVFSAKRGEKITITLDKKPEQNHMIFMDLFEHDPLDPESSKFVSSNTADTNVISIDVDEVTNYLLRLQPELLKSSEYSLTIATGPSLGYPVQSSTKNNIQSFWGDGRDAGSRKHEGIDIFDKRNTPVIAAANGVVTRVNTTNLGGKVVWLRPEGKNYTLYYAHLDSQVVAQGQKVSLGDTLGLMGNTGNAVNTAPHLHFGIYTFKGATDPLAFVKPNTRTPGRIYGKTGNLNSMMRVSRSVKAFSAPDAGQTGSQTLKPGTPVLIEAASAHWYKVRLPEDETRFINYKYTESITSPTKKLKLAEQYFVYDKPDTAALRKDLLPGGSGINVIGDYGNYYFISYDNGLSGWISK